MQGAGGTYLAGQQVQDGGAVRKERLRYRPVGKEVHVSFISAFDIEQKLGVAGMMV